MTTETTSSCLPQSSSAPSPFEAPHNLLLAEVVHVPLALASVVSARNWCGGVLRKFLGSSLQLGPSGDAHSCQRLWERTFFEWLENQQISRRKAWETIKVMIFVFLWSSFQHHSDSACGITHLLPLPPGARCKRRGRNTGASLRSRTAHHLQHKVLDHLSTAGGVGHLSAADWQRYSVAQQMSAGLRVEFHDFGSI